MDTLTKSGSPEPMRCHHCDAPLNFNDETLDQDVSCPTCGSRSPLSDPQGGKSPLHHKRFGRFELLENVGSGHFGVVYRANDTKLKRIIALKVPRRRELTPHIRNMFQRDAMGAAALNHPNIVRLYEVVDVMGRPCIVSEFIHGDNLKTFLAGENFATRKEAVEFMVATADAVHHAHQRGIIHRDLKPGNLLVDGAHLPHLTDFGLAKIASHEQSMTAYPGQLVGTLAYMSPEQAGGEVHGLGVPSDVFSLGVILYEVLTGVRPFAGEVLAEIVDNIRHAEPKKLREIKPDLHPDLESVCLKAISKEPHRRYHSAGELADDLRRYLADLPTHARPVTKSDRAFRWLRKNMTVAAISLVALLSTSAAALIPLRSPTPGYAKVNLATEPPGAEIRLFPLDPVTGEPMTNKAIRTSGTTPMSHRIPPGDYLVVAKLADGRFHEVYRRVPQDPNKSPDGVPHRHWWVDKQGNLNLSPIHIPVQEVQNGMAEFTGKHAFFVDPSEVTAGAFRTAFKHEFPGGIGTFDGLGRMPMTGTLYDYVVAYAELVGKRLPTVDEFEYAATNGQTTKFPWGNKPPTALSTNGSLQFDQTICSTIPVFGLCSNGGEFTSTPYVGDLATAGGPSKVMLQIPAEEHVTIAGLVDEGDAEMQRRGVMRRLIPDNIGFRCVRSKTPRW